MKLKFLINFMEFILNEEDSRATHGSDRKFSFCIPHVDFAICYNTIRGLDVASVVTGSFFFFSSPVCVPAIIAVGGCLSGEKRRVLSDWRSPWRHVRVGRRRTHVVNHVVDAKTEGERADAAVRRRCSPVVNTCPRHTTEDLLTCPS